MQENNAKLKFATQQCTKMLEMKNAALKMWHTIYKCCIFHPCILGTVGLRKTKFIMITL